MANEGFYIHENFVGLGLPVPEKLKEFQKIYGGEINEQYSSSTSKNYLTKP
ncbi:hypothetical protein [Ignavigranum ruoffiae]|uniref:hypothetical protein n=1 Tax=Ignavigranum ruoffiae TaxID=89093 RepID=UPI003D1541FE